MAVTKKNKFGQVSISIDAIASVAGDAALECYGVVGIANKGGIIGKIDAIISKDDYSKGVSVIQTRSSVSISLYLVISTGVKVTEVLSEVQKKVRYVTSKTFELKINKVNVYAVSLRKIN